MLLLRSLTEDGPVLLYNEVNISSVDKSFILKCGELYTLSRH